MIINKKLIFLGLISSAHGIKGHALVKSLTNPPINICKMQLLFQDGADVKLKLIRELPSGGLICSLNQINTRTEIEQLIGSKLFCYRDTMEKLQEDEFYVEDLSGMEVRNENMVVIGKVEHFYNFGAGDIVEIRFLNKKLELLPFNKEFFPAIHDEYIVLKDMRY